jgi:phenylpropionate dioxygenase-like ring-hydroxylating dioxygenase large terminal subunit
MAQRTPGDELAIDPSRYDSPPTDRVPFAPPPTIASRRSGRDLSVGEILAALDRAARLPLSQSVTSPRQAYVSPDFFEWEIERVFRDEWLCVAHVSQLPGPGTFVNLELVGEPLVVVRDREGQVRVLSRVCPHRGMDIMPPGFGYAGFEPLDLLRGRRGHGEGSVLVCPYHNWTFGLDGRVKGCAEMHLCEGFRPREYGLAEFRSELWEGFVFVNLSGGARPLAEQLAALSPLVAPWRMGDLEVVIEQSWDCPFNWKVMVENWMESYHHLGIHHDTLQPMMPAKDTWTEGEQPHFIRSHLPLRPGLVHELEDLRARGEVVPGFIELEGLTAAQRAEWGLHLGLPCFMFLVTSDRVIWYRLEPIDADRCRLLTTTLVSRAARAAPDFEQRLASEAELLRGFHVQDMQVCSAVQRGLRSSAFRGGRLSHLEMPVWLIQRYVAARGRATWPTLDRPPAPGQRD